MSRFIGAELTNYTIKKPTSRLKYVAYESDTALLRLYQNGSIQRDSSGYLDQESLKQHLLNLNVPLSRLICLYDVTAHQSFSEWKMPSVIMAPGGISPVGSVVISTIASNASVNEFDSLWCKISYFDYVNPSNTKHATIAANDGTCSGEPIECVVHTIGRMERSSPDAGLQFISNPPDQHWGKIIGGTVMVGSGIGLIALSGIMDEEFRGLGRVGGGALICGGAVFLSVGIVKQARYYK